MQRVVLDTNVVIAYLRGDQPHPNPLHGEREALLPIPVIGELFAGAYHSKRPAENLAKVEQVVASLPSLHPDLETARVYGRLRAVRGRATVTPSQLNDLWIAALCIHQKSPHLAARFSQR